MTIYKVNYLQTDEAKYYMFFADAMDACKDYIIEHEQEPAGAINYFEYQHQLEGVISLEDIELHTSRN